MTKEECGMLRMTEQDVGNNISFAFKPHAAMLHTGGRVVQSYCDARRKHAMCCDAFSNMLEDLLPISEYLSHLFSNFQTVFSIVVVIV